MKRSFCDNNNNNNNDDIDEPGSLDLPDELWRHILRTTGLNYQYCIRRGLLRVSKRWHRLVLGTFDTLKRLYGLTAQHLVQLAPTLTSLDLRHGGVSRDTIERALPLLTNLKRLDCGATWMHVAPTPQSSFTTLSGTLTSLDARQCMGAALAVQQMTGLQDLTLSLGRGSCHRMTSIIAGQTDLTRLVSLASCVDIDCAALLNMTRLCELLWYGNITNVSEVAQQRHLTNLTSLSLPHCTGNDMDTLFGLLFRGPDANITALDIGGSIGVTDAILHRVQHCSRLASLRIANCPLVTDDAISRLTALTALNLFDYTPRVTCRSLVCLPRLSHLVTGYGITDADLDEMGSRLTALTRLETQVHLVKRGVGALWRSLVRLRIDGVVTTTGRNHLDALLSGMGLSHLTALECDFGVRLSDAGLVRCASRLVSLRVQSNDQLTDAALILCTSLKQLSVPYCDNITGASVSTLTNLRSLYVAYRGGQDWEKHSPPIDIAHVMPLTNLTALDHQCSGATWPAAQLCRYLPSLSDLSQSLIHPMIRGVKK